MKLTPIDVQQQQFRLVMRGYDRREVASFLDLVSQQMGELARDNSELRADLRRVKSELEEHKQREQTLREAMLTAQRAIDEIREQAEKEARLMLTEAELRAEKIVYDAHKRVTKVIEDIQELKRQRARAIEELRGVLNTHVRLLAIEEEGSDKEQEPQASVMVLEHIRPPALPKSEEIEPARVGRSG